MQEGHIINHDSKHVLVGIPLYNSEETIASIVLSCLNYSDEVVCIDDCSTDSSA